MLNPFWLEKYKVKRLGSLKRVNVKGIKIQSQGCRIHNSFFLSATEQIFQLCAKLKYGMKNYVKFL